MHFNYKILQNYTIIKYKGHFMVNTILRVQFSRYKWRVPYSLQGRVEFLTSPFPLYCTLCYSWRTSHEVPFIHIVIFVSMGNMVLTVILLLSAHFKWHFRNCSLHQGILPGYFYKYKEKFRFYNRGKTKVSLFLMMQIYIVLIYAKSTLKMITTKMECEYINANTFYWAREPF